MNSSGNITYIYDATGVKLKKITTEGSSLTTEYAGNYVYKNGTLEFFNHTEGIVEHEADGYKYVYQYKDHLGNIRLSYKDADKNGSITTSEVIEVKDYYPFGMRINYGVDHPNSMVNGRKHNYSFNGKEFDENLGLNLIEMDWRHYDPTIGRFPSIDPLADHPFQLDLTPYNFAWNNPIMYNDPSGLCPECPNASDFNVGDTHDINGVTYVVDNDGQWAREGGSLGEVVINSGDNTESTRNRIDLNAPYGGKISRSIGNLSGWDKFSAEAQENMPWLFGRRTSDDGRFFVDPSGNSIGIVPMGAPINLPFGPGGSKNLINGLDDLIKAATKIDKGALTKVGRALQKHGSRPGSVFPKATGNPASINAQGEAVLRSILTNPSATTTVRHHARFGDIMDIQIPGGQGVRFSADGKTFIHFLE